MNRISRILLISAALLAIGCARLPFLRYKRGPKCIHHYQTLELESQLIRCNTVLRSTLPLIRSCLVNKDYESISAFIEDLRGKCMAPRALRELELLVSIARTGGIGIRAFDEPFTEALGVEVKKFLHSGRDSLLPPLHTELPQRFACSHAGRTPWHLARPGVRETGRVNGC